MRRALAFLLASFTFASLSLVAVAPADAQEEEARLLFERGNQHLARGMRSRGARRTRELQEALDAYLGVLRLGARTRNVVFNLALTLQELGREAEAFNYYSQYLREFDLSDADRTTGRERLEALRPRVAVAQVTSTPDGAEVRVDRRDLPVRGTTPLELALPEGQHRLFFSLEGYGEQTAQVTVATGQRVDVAVTLEGEPVPVQFIAPGGGALTLDGDPIEAGRAIPVAPGSHVVRLEVPNAAPVERRFEVQAGSDPMAIELSAAAGAGSARVSVHTNAEAQVFLDGIPVGNGAELSFPALPGEHVLRVEAPGRAEASHRFELRPDQMLSLDVVLGERPDNGGLVAGRLLTGVPALVALVGAGIALGISADLRGQWDDWLARQDSEGATAQSERELTRIADDLEAATLATDILWITSATLGTLAVVLMIVSGDAEEESTVEVAVGAGSIAVRGAF